MFRTLLMTALAVVAIGFGVGSTAEAGESGNFSDGPYSGSKKYAGVTVFHRCSDLSTVYVLWLPSGSTVVPQNLTLAELLAIGARPVDPWFLMGTTLPGLAPGDGVLWAFDGVGGSFGSLPATIARGPDSNYFKITGPSSAPVVSRL